MQNLVFYVAANETLGAVRDYANAKTAAPPVMARGVPCCLKMRLFALAEGDEPYPIEELSSIVNWRWVMDTDFDAASQIILKGDDGAITAAAVTEEIDNERRTFTEVKIPISDMETRELADTLGSDESISNLNGELTGYNGEGKAAFVLQIKNFTVRNRIEAGNGATSSPPSSQYLTAEQVRALVAAGIELGFSRDNANWHREQQDGDQYYRFCSASSESALWSTGIKLIPGTAGKNGENGKNGESVYGYTAWATDSNGTGFVSDTGSRTENHKYFAILLSNHIIPSPRAGDFAGRWFKVVDVNPNWSDIANTPDLFPTCQNKIADSPRQTYRKIESLDTLYINSVIHHAVVSSGGPLALAVERILDGGNSPYTAKEGDVFTWELWLDTAEEIELFPAVKIQKLEGCPATLALLNKKMTRHVFTLRGRYKAGEMSNLKLILNYAYSEEV